MTSSPNFFADEPSAPCAPAFLEPLVATHDSPDLDWLTEAPDEALHLRIRSLSAALFAGRHPVWVVAALGRPLLDAHVRQLALELRIPAADTPVDTRAAWALAQPKLEKFFPEDDVEAGGRDVVGALDFLELVESYGRPGAAPITDRTWPLDRDQVSELLRRAHETLTGFTTGVQVLTEQRDDVARELADMADDGR